MIAYILGIAVFMVGISAFVACWEIEKVKKEHGKRIERVEQELGI